MEIVTFKIVGTYALLTHNPENMRSGPKTPSASRIPSPEDEANAALYKNDKGEYCIRSIAFRSALLHGLRGKKIGKVSAASRLQAAVFNDDNQELCVLLDPKTEKPLTDYVIDIRRAVIQRQGVMRARPRFNDWMTHLNLMIDLDEVSPALIEEHLNVAGRVIGAGDFRVERTGPFGRFTAALTNGHGGSK